MVASSWFHAAPRVRQSGAQGKTARAGRWLAACFALLAAACQPAPDPSASSVAPTDEDAVTVYVASNGWHSMIVVPRAALPAGVLPEAADFPDAPYLGFGWGDAAYFPARAPTLALSLQAALQPTPSVVHLAGLRAPPQEVFPDDEVAALRISFAGFGRLVAYLDGTFDRQGAPRARTAAPGLFDFSLFYPAEGEFHLFNTCNRWTARGLQAGGLPVRAAGVVSAEDLMVQLRPLGERLEPAPPGE